MSLFTYAAATLFFNSSSILLSLPSSKTDQDREGFTVILAQSGTPTCPVAVIERYYTRAALELRFTDFLFWGLVHMKKGVKLRKPVHISNMQVPELMLQRLTKLGCDAQEFSIHSFRAGEPQQQLTLESQTDTSSAMSAGTESAKDGYVKDWVQSHLSVFRSVKL